MNPCGNEGMRHPVDESLLADDVPHSVLGRCEAALDDLNPSERERLRHITSVDYYDPWDGCWWSPFGGE